MGVAIPRRPALRFVSAAVLCGAAFAVAATLTFAVGQPESSVYRQVAMSRPYWFLSQWQWYEWAGIAGPMAILSFTAFDRRWRHNDALNVLCRMVLLAGIISFIVALIFARVNAETLLVARLQPLRIFQMVYLVMILILGAALASLLQASRLRWIGAFAFLAAIMFAAERQTFPASAHLELQDALSRQPSSNSWIQAFDWIRGHTPKDALFAMDADYINKPGEDAQCFRAIAERSALPDYSKDGGEAAITPALAAEWNTGQRIQTKLSEQSDEERIAALRPAGVNWIVLEEKARTSFTCAYANAAVKVCRLPAMTPGGVQVAARN
jgi:hypothetical protein